MLLHLHDRLQVTLQGEVGPSSWCCVCGCCHGGQQEQQQHNNHGKWRDTENNGKKGSEKLAETTQASGMTIKMEQE
jgi:hypothetical protein